MNCPCGIVSHFFLLSPLATSSTATIYLARDDSSSLLFAIKIHPQNSLPFAMETASLRQLSNQSNVIAMREAETGAVMVDEDGEKTLVDFFAMDYCGRGALIDVFASGVEFGEQIVRKWFKEVVTALATCHKREIAHLDIKLDNILLSDSFSATLSDFGCAAHTSSRQIHGRRGTLSCRSPEMFFSDSFDPFAADIFALGVLLFSMCMRQSPFREASSRCIHYVTYRENPREFWKMRGKLCAFLGKDLRELLGQLLAHRPEERPSAVKVLRHRWVRREVASCEEIRKVFPSLN